MLKEAEPVTKKWSVFLWFCLVVIISGIAEKNSYRQPIHKIW